MESLMDRRGFLRGMIGGAAAVTLAAGAGVTLLPNVAEAAAVPADKGLPEAMEDFVENVQHRRHYRRHGHHHHHHRHRRRYHHHHWHRRRRRHCWWHRGRRVCGWRYW